MAADFRELAYFVRPRNTGTYTQTNFAKMWTTGLTHMSSEGHTETRTMSRIAGQWRRAEDS